MEQPALTGYPTPMTDADFKRLADFIERELGIKMPEAKRVMLESRLSRRLRLYGIASFAEYADFVFSEAGKGAELIHMINAVTTNKTDFFRESDHFDQLLNTVLPELHKRGVDTVRLWSAGCSTGEEPYTVAIVMEEYRRTLPKLQYQILATDLSTQVLEKAVAAVYDEEKAAAVPLDYRKRYFLRSRDPERRLVRIRPELRARVDFRRLNFMDADFGLRDPFHVIFCRNVIIYFDKPTQETLLAKFYALLAPGGFLFLGHSETLAGMRLPFITRAPTVYQKE
jgi:chemotaxis protein methyltransferase CheR